MAIPKDNLRLIITFLDELKQVKVLATTDRPDSQLCIMGVVEGREQLQDLLVKAEIDHYLVCSGDPFTVSFRVTAFERSPKRMLEDLEKIFQRAAEIPLKILRGETLTDEEKSFETPPYLHVCSSLMKTNDGLKGIQAWFDARKKVLANASGG